MSIIFSRQTRIGPRSVFPSGSIAEATRAAAAAIPGNVLHFALVTCLVCNQFLAANLTLPSGACGKNDSGSLRLTRNFQTLDRSTTDRTTNEERKWFNKDFETASRLNLEDARTSTRDTVQRHNRRGHVCQNVKPHKVEQHRPRATATRCRKRFRIH